MFEVKPQTAIEKAQILVNKVLKDANLCRDTAFKLKPLKMSGELTKQLTACAVKFQEQAEVLQKKILHKNDQNSQYAGVISQVDSLSQVAKDRLEIAKALLRASEKSAKPPKAAAKAKASAAPESKSPKSV